ncbi:MAG TPA: zinc dependent phospholipase C family protein [Ktedonobacteraceae bacterium]
MPAFLTHWRILIETARNSQDAGGDLGSLIIDADALRRRAHGWSTPPQTTPAGAVWDTGPLPEIDFRFPGSDISAMAFLGALAPDVIYYHSRYLRAKFTDAYLRAPQARSLQINQAPQWSELFHRSHSGELPILFLEQVALIPAPALRSQALAFALGYISHVATDIALNPWISALAPHAPQRRARGPHCSFELLVDEYLAGSYFEHERYNLLHQPWEGYIEPAARNLSQSGTPTSQLLQILASAAEVYRLQENQAATLPADFLAGLRGLRRFLSGSSGIARWLALRARSKKAQSDAIHALLHDSPAGAETIPLEEMLRYATRLSEHLCRRAINYYTALRNSNAEASERSYQRASLVSDLRNWDLYTGYATSSEPATEASLPLHNWVHFSHLWENATPAQEQIARLIGQPG